MGRKAKQRATMKLWRLMNPERAAELHANWKDAGFPHRRRERYANKKQRQQILERDGYKCRYCGQPLTNATANMDHVFPFKYNGRTTLKNMVACCRPCNRLKGNRRDLKPM